MKEFDKLIRVVKKLRGKNGCPWDREQTHKTLTPYIIEESYELLDAINGRDDKKLKEELGDVLLQVILHSQIGCEKKKFDIKDVIECICEKMIRRHPHVFAGRRKTSIEDIWHKWEEIKKGENKSKSVLDSVPRVMPALYRADKIQKKAARSGFDWDSVAGAWAKVDEELCEVMDLLKINRKDKKRIKEELGDLLFSIVNVSRKLDINAEEALQVSISKFYKRFNYIEKYSNKKNIKLKEIPSSDLEKLWVKAKAAAKMKS